MAAIWTYVQAHPAMAVFAVALVAFFVMGVSGNWSWLKAKLPAIVSPKNPTVVPVAGLNQREAIDYSIALQGYFAIRDCPEGVEAATQSLAQACRHRPPVIMVSPQNATPAAATTITVTGHGPLTASQP